MRTWATKSTLGFPYYRVCLQDLRLRRALRTARGAHHGMPNLVSARGRAFVSTSTPCNAVEVVRQACECSSPVSSVHLCLSRPRQARCGRLSRKQWLTTRDGVLGQWRGISKKRVTERQAATMSRTKASHRAAGSCIALCSSTSSICRCSPEPIPEMQHCLRRGQRCRRHLRF